MKRVAKFALDGELLAVYPSLQAAADSIPGASSGGICKCCRGGARSAYGFRWEYYRLVSDSDTEERSAT